jgi:hypothetical protein
MNPYEILKVAPDADKQTIIKAAALAMRERVFSAKDIALAQKILLNPARGAGDILGRLDFDAYLAEIDVPMPPPLSEDIPDCAIEGDL